MEKNHIDKRTSENENVKRPIAQATQETPLTIPRTPSHFNWASDPFIAPTVVNTLQCWTPNIAPAKRLAYDIGN